MEKVRSNPGEVYQEFFSQNPADADDNLNNLIKSSVNVDELPFLNVNCHFDEIPDGYLVRVQGFIQDSMENEYYMDNYEKVSSDGERVRSTAKYRDFDELGDFELDEKSVKLSERFSFHVVPLPGLTDWALKRISRSNKFSFGSCIGSKRKHEEDPSSKKLRKNFPLIEEENGKNHGVIIRVYKGGADIALSSCIQFVGILEHPRLLQLTDQEKSNLDLVVPKVHALSWEIFDFCSIARCIENTRENCRDSVLNILHGATKDELLSKYLFLHMIALPLLEMDSPFATDICSINVYSPKDEFITIMENLNTLMKELVTQIAKVSIDVKSLNTGDNLWPVRDTELMKLRSGRLQLNSGVQVLVNEVGLEEGKLDSVGILNLRAISLVTTKHQLPIDFQIYTQNFPCALNMLNFSKTPSLIKPTTNLPWVPSASVEPIKTSEIVPDELDQLRDYVTRLKYSESDYRISEEFQEVLNKNFVDWRQDKSTFVTPEEFSFMLYLLRLWTISGGKINPDLNDWNQVITLERERKSRL